METCFEYTDEKWAYLSTDQKSLIAKLNKIIESNPDSIKIIKRPEDNDGVLYIRLPVKYFKISAPIKRNISEERRELMRERGLKLAEERRKRRGAADDNNQND